ncbi:MAG: ribose-5-phosphate isomerase RpiA [Gemmatimonadaceae bacterium]|nr:ribose-5-phosphate isomerase RpiA [Acetobacteraceae bacterium]
MAQLPAGKTLDQTALKQQAADAAVAGVEDGMVVGLGTGSTAALAVAALGVRVNQGLRIVGIPTSERTADQARSMGIPLVGFDTHTAIDLTIDGADEVDIGTLDLIKGLGGALLREKIVAAASRRMTVVVDEGKLVPTLGGVRLPVEVVAFGAEATLARLNELGAAAAIRRGPDGPFRTDGGNLIADCGFGPIADPRALHAAIKSLVGVVETGLFIGMATRIIAGTQTGPRILEL